jgi:hypothetical protein
MENIFRVLKPRNGDDVAKIRAAIRNLPVINRLSLSDIEVELLWERYSGDYGASYLLVIDQTLTDFIEWVQQ